jgi:hypothetical protein
MGHAASRGREQAQKRRGCAKGERNLWPDSAGRAGAVPTRSPPGSAEMRHDRSRHRHVNCPFFWQAAFPLAAQWLAALAPSLSTDLPDASGDNCNLCTARKRGDRLPARRSAICPALAYFLGKPFLFWWLNSLDHLLQRCPQTYPTRPGITAVYALAHRLCAANRPGAEPPACRLPIFLATRFSAAGSIACTAYQGVFHRLARRHAG